MAKPLKQNNPWQNISMHCQKESKKYILKQSREKSQQKSNHLCIKKTLASLPCHTIPAPYQHHCLGSFGKFIRRWNERHLFQGKINSSSPNKWVESPFWLKTNPSHKEIKLQETYVDYTPENQRMSPLKMAQLQKERIVFQQLFFRGHVSFWGRNYCDIKCIIDRFDRYLRRSSTCAFSPKKSYQKADILHTKGWSRYIIETFRS